MTETQNIDEAVGAIRTYYLNLPKVDLTEGGEFVGEILEQLIAEELDRQRIAYVEAVKNRKATIKWLWGKQKTDDECFLMVMDQVQRIISDVFKKARE